MKLKDKKGLTLVEMLCTVAILVLVSMVMVLGVQLGVRSYAKSVSYSEAQVLCSTLTTTISDELRYSGTLKVDGSGEQLAGQSGVLVLDDLIGALEGFLTEIPRHHSQGGEHIDVLRLRTLPVKAVQCLGGDGVRPGNQFIDLPDKLFFLYILSPSVYMDSPPRDGPWLG